MNIRDNYDYYLKKGFSILPCRQDKKPFVSTWTELQKRQPSSEELDKWAKAYPEANVAIICGRISDLTVVDCDSTDAINLVEGYIPDTLEVPTVTTPRGGRHYYFRCAPVLHSRNGVATNVDVKSEGGYVLAPPSWTNEGAYVMSPLDIDERPGIPESLLEFLKKGESNQSAGIQGAPFTQGRRDADIFHLSLQLFKDGRAYEEVERIALDMANVANPPFPEREAKAKVKSAYKRIQRLRQSGCLEKDTSSDPKTNIVRMSDVEKTPIEWLWPNRFPLGMLSIVAGKQGQGKSTLMIHMACRLSKAEDWPDAPGSGAPITTLLVTCEDPREQVIKYRIEANGGDDYFIKHFDTVYADGEELPFDLTTNLKVLEQHLIEDHNIKCVIIDPLASHMGGRIDSNNPFQTRWHLSPLARLAKKYDVAIIGIAHFKKGDDVMDAMDKVAGSYQFTSLPRAVWVVMEDKEDPAKIKRHAFLPGKINIVNAPTGLYFRIETVQIDGQEAGRIVFEDEIANTTANELLEKNARTRTTTWKEIEAFITQSLMDGPMLAKPNPDTDDGKSIEGLLTARGFSLSYADKVKTELKKDGKLRYGRREEGGPWWMYLPEAPGLFGRR